MSDRYLSKAEASDYLGLSVRTLEARKDIPRYQIQKGGKVLFRKSELDQWMARHRVCVWTENENLTRLVDEVVEDVLRA
jgi:excisionase family DNA binding protein